MSILSWPEIRQRAIVFSHSFADAKKERAEAQTFWNEFFKVFGLERKLVATFEEPVKSLKNTLHSIDLFWKGKMLAEHKSRGESLEKAQSQAFDYLQDLVNEGRQHELPRYILLSDFARMVLYDLEPDCDPGDLHASAMERHEFLLQDLHRHVKEFAFLIGQQTVRFRAEDAANLQAAQLMADLHDTVEASGYTGHDLERLLVRLLFCLFADDTGIFEPGQFELFVRNRTHSADLGNQLFALFHILNTDSVRRQSGLDEDLAGFPYINGDLFAEIIQPPAFTSDMRNSLLAAASFNWGRISPAVFGSLFQGIMDDKERRQIGAHYTSERDILKLIRPLFLDALHGEFEQLKALKQKNRREKELVEFQNKLAGLKFLDPACGCGNFLVVAYRELRRLETDILLFRHKTAVHQEELPAGEMLKLSKVDVHQFYGIEIEEWPARIAETALWLTDHQMNIELSLAFGNQFQRIPLKSTPHIRHGNALRFDWNELLPAAECSYVMGNPPFVGHHNQTAEQKLDQHLVLRNLPARGVLDYVSNWYVKACEYMADTPLSLAFVSTNSITQGEQAGILWSELYGRYNVHIIFAYRTFPWTSEAKGMAHVHVVIIGLTKQSRDTNFLFQYDEVRNLLERTLVRSINPYLVEGPEVVLNNRQSPLCNVPSLIWGSKPTDGGNLILEDEEYRVFMRENPAASVFIKPLICAHQFLHGQKRWCLWLVDAKPQDIKSIPSIVSRVAMVRRFRLASKASSTRAYADRPTLFRQIAVSASTFIVIPLHSSEHRTYIPLGFFGPENIVHNSCSFLPNATPYHFGILTSTMHMSWVRQVCGRLESRYRYSSTLVYNNYPWPTDPTPAQRTKVGACVQAVLDTREKYIDQGSTLADLYDPLYMPGDLLKAHQQLDRAVDRCYRAAPFTSERERVEYLFQLYEQLTSPLAPTDKPRPRRKRPPSVRG